MGGDGVSDISAGAGEGVGGMVNGAGLTSGSIARLGASRGGSTVGVETRVDNELALFPFHFCLFPAFPGFPYYTTLIN